MWVPGNHNHHNNDADGDDDEDEDVNSNLGIVPKKNGMIWNNICLIFYETFLNFPPPPPVPQRKEEANFYGTIAYHH